MAESSHPVTPWWRHGSRKEHCTTSHWLRHLLEQSQYVYSCAAPEGIQGGLCTQVGQDAVVVEADAIKNHDVVSITLKEKLGDDPDIDRFVHEYSTTAAEIMLVTAINEQKDIIFDGTMTWLPFVEQTIAMARDHRHNYKRGPGYYQDASGKVHEKYWEIDHEARFDPESKVPYKIELVGVTCDPGKPHLGRIVLEECVQRWRWLGASGGRFGPVEESL